MKRQLNTLRQWAAALLAGLGLIGQANGDSSTGLSSVFTVDLSSATITVSGRVLDAKNRAAVSAATVTLAGQTTSSSGAGLFSFDSVSLSGGGTLTVSKSGYMTATEAPSVPAGSKSVTMPDILLQAAVANKPVVTGLKPKYDGIFLSAASLLNDYTASVNWNGTTPGSVKFYVNGTLRQTVNTTAGAATATLDMALGFNGSLTLGGNKVKVVAVDGLGTESTPFEQAVTIIPMPLFLVDQAILKPFEFIPGNQPAISWEFNFPGSLGSARDVRQIPFIGNFGPDFNFDVAFDYDLLSGEWGLFVGKEWDKRLRYRAGQRLHSTPLGPKFYLGNVDFNYGFGGKAEGVASLTQGIVVERVGVELSAGVRLEILTFYFTDYVPGGQLIRLLDKLKWIGVDVNSIQRVRVFGLFDASFSAMLKFPSLQFDNATLNLQPGVEALYEPSMVAAHGSIAVGGNLGFDLQLAPAFGWDKVTGAIYLKLHFDAWLMEPYDVKLFILQGTIYQRSGASVAQVLASGSAVKPFLGDGQWVAYQIRSSSTGVISRDYLSAGPERFVAGDSERQTKLTPAGGMTPLEAFRALGQSPPRSAASLAQEARSGADGVQPKGNPQPKGAVESPAQADLTLVQNAFPNSSPAMAARGTELMLLYVTDNGITNSLQYTDIAWTRWDGTNWSMPLAIRTNTQAEFAPQVAYDGNGDAIAAWERVADPNFNQTNLTAMAQQMEIVWSRWSRANGTWSEPVALTANSYLDHAPLLCGPMANGNVLLTWTKNEANLLMGTNGPGADVVMGAEWSAASRSWGASEVLLSSVAYRLSQSLAGTSNYAVYAWTKDMGGVLTNDTDQEVFYLEHTSGAWGAARQFTTNGIADKNVRVAVSPKVSSGGSIQEGFESGNFTKLPWTSGGSAAWTVQNSVVKSGAFAAASGGIADNQTSSMSVAVNCSAGVVSFSYRVSSESGYDYLRFFIDGQSQGQWSGEVGWATVSYPVAAGPHTFEWRYTKDSSASSGSDKAWVDDIQISGQARGVFAVWQQGTNLVMSEGFSGIPKVARADSQTAGFADYALALGPLGHLVLLWQEMSVNGSDAHYAVYDPVADGWSRDDLLCQDPPLERSFAPVWDAQGNLTVAYNKVQILHTNMTLTVEGGGSVTVSNVPQSGRVDLVVTKRALVKDLELAAGEFTAGGVNYLPGDPLALSATVRNRGNVAVSNVVVGFYDGNPDAGGVLMTNVTLPGWLEAAGTNVASAVWVVPEPATNHTLYAVANRAGLAGEFNGSNNVQSVRIGGTDLTVGLVSYQAETNGAVRVIAQVQNLGAPTAAKSVLAIRQQGQTNAPLATVAVPVLEPGRLAQLALDLPAGTQPAGEQLYTLTADETHVTSDVDTNNNTAAFAVNLWIDSDADGLPDNWMIQYFGHATGQASDLSQAQDDADSDGVSNLAEYLAGTNPKDPHSYLSLTGIGLGGTNGVQIAWGSAPNKLYSLQRAVVLSGGLGFTNIAEHILSTPPENVYLDASATNSAAFFYRIRVE
jgi:hypothetical protein